MRKKPAPQPAQDEGKEKKKVGIFEEDNDDMDFSVSRRSTMNPKKSKKPIGTTVEPTDFAASKPTFAARKKKVGTIVGA